MAKPTIHSEKSRSWWTGASKTLCGLTITKVTVSGYGWLGPTLHLPGLQGDREGQQVTGPDLVRRPRVAVRRFVATCAAGCGNTVPPGQVMCSTCANR